MGTSQIVCGFRDDWGMVHKLENFEVLEIPRMAGVSAVFDTIYYRWSQILNIFIGESEDIYQNVPSLVLGHLLQQKTVMKGFMCMVT